MTTKEFIALHLNDDVRRLALAKAPDGVDLHYALLQIDGRQRARTKLPGLVANPDIVFPVHLSVEQCSSEVTAQYKRQILNRLSNGTETALLDLTGGFGIDFIHLAPLFPRAVYVERDAGLCQIARHNFSALKLDNAEIINAEAETVLPAIALPQPLLIFLDPARRDNAGKRTFAISDCTPDVISLIPQIKTMPGVTLFLKLSPMLDWHKAVADIQSAGMKVPEVHIVSVKNECKELLIIARNPENFETSEYSENSENSPRLFCKNDDSLIEIPAKLESRSQDLPQAPNSFLLLPNASIMKAGCWDFLTNAYNVRKADANSHVFFSDRDIPDFPGQSFCIEKVFSLNKKELRDALGGISHANISVRNFPLSAEELRKRLKMKDGGQHHIFATTISGEHKLILTSSSKS